MTGPFLNMTGVRVMKDEPLARHTSLRVGGRARYFVRVHSRRALRNVLHVIAERSMKYVVIGAGTNVLCGDDGFPGAVLQLAGIFKRIVRDADIFHCGAGVRIERFLEVTSDLGFGGSEFLAGIPGTIGGGIKGNAGAFGRSFADITQQVTILDKHGIERHLDQPAIKFGYRSTDIGNSNIIISAAVRLQKGRRRNIRKLINDNITYRWQHQPRGYSAGSFFKNPVPRAAGRLIEECGLKGLRVGNAEVSTKHANFIINRGCASASDILRLARKIQNVVMKKKGIRLQMEVKLLR
jgi:UDP-N-acetylmuramate dehydrogenase